MDLLADIDLYCERLAPGFWNEPFNALSNAAFVIAALWAYYFAWKRGDSDLPERAVILLAGLVGIGSFLFHTFANGWSELADVIPIWSFVACYVLLTIYRSTGENTLKTARIGLIIVSIIAAVFWFSSDSVTTDQHAFEDLFNGSLQYAPAMLALMLFAIITQVKKHAIRHHIATATGLFCLSLIFRTVDVQVCASIIIGTHFMWHILNAVMLGVLLHALVKHLPPEGAALSS